jgi:hypothetical protein
MSEDDQTMLQLATTGLLKPILTIVMEYAPLNHYITTVKLSSEKECTHLFESSEKTEGSTRELRNFDGYMGGNIGSAYTVRMGLGKRYSIYCNKRDKITPPEWLHAPNETIMVVDWQNKDVRYIVLPIKLEPNVQHVATISGTRLLLLYGDYATPCRGITHVFHICLDSSTILARAKMSNWDTPLVLPNCHEIYALGPISARGGEYCVRKCTNNGEQTLQIIRFAKREQVVLTSKFDQMEGTQNDTVFITKANADREDERTFAFKFEKMFGSPKDLIDLSGDGPF